MPVTFLTQQSSQQSSQQDNQPTDSQLKQLGEVVAIGGGHGLGRVLSALSDLGEQLTGIVTTTDNGGSTGRLREAEDCIAWGDLRNCINQLITEPSIGSSLFEYRFRGNSDIAGHNLGNLMLLALDQMCVRPVDAINLIRDMLKIKNHILPMSEDPTHLVAYSYADELIKGEVSIDRMLQMPKHLAVQPQVSATPEALEAIKNAKLIILGPGSFLTSIMPPLLLPDLKQAILNSTAKKVFITNLVPEDSPLKYLSKKQLLAWINTTTDLPMPDAILSHSARTRFHPPYYFANISSSSSTFHNRDKLRSALELLVEELFDAPEGQRQGSRQ